MRVAHMETVDKLFPRDEPRKKQRRITANIGQAPAGFPLYDILVRVSGRCADIHQAYKLISRPFLKLQIEQRVQERF